MFQVSTDTVLDLSSQKIDDGKIRQLLESGELLSVSFLQIHNNNITDFGVMMLLMSLPNLTFLDVRFNPISDVVRQKLERYRWQRAIEVRYFDSRIGFSTTVYLNQKLGYDFTDNIMRLNMDQLNNLQSHLIKYKDCSMFVMACKAHAE